MKTEFRAWDNVKGCMYYLGEDENVVFAFVSSGIIATDITEREDEFSLLHHLQYMQYTGLNDSKCNKICDGDIVLRKGKMYRIIFEMSSFMLSPIDDIDMDEEFINCWNDHVYPLSQLYFENGDLEDILSDLTVIGNIYQNEDLLEGE